MSKLERTNTTTEEEIANGPLIFKQLEALTNWLINDALALHEDFLRKSESALEDFVKIIKNENCLEEIGNFMQVLQNNISIAEQELQEIECHYNYLSMYVDHIEKLCQMEPFCVTNGICQCGGVLKCCCQSERKMFLNKIENMEILLPLLPELIDQMQELQKYSCKKNPNEKIFSILNYHTETLKRTEKNMDLLADKLAIIDQQQTELANEPKNHLKDKIKK